MMHGRKNIKLQTNKLGKIVFNQLQNVQWLAHNKKVKAVP